LPVAVVRSSFGRYDVLPVSWITYYQSQIQDGGRKWSHKGTVSLLVYQNVECHRMKDQTLHVGGDFAHMRAVQPGFVGVLTNRRRHAHHRHYASTMHLH